MKLMTRLLFAPAIVSSYTIYGVVVLSKHHSVIDKTSFKVSDFLGGAAAGAIFGVHYVFTGESFKV